MGGGCTLIFSYIRRLWLFWGFIIEFQYVWGFSEDFVDIFFFFGGGGGGGGAVITKLDYT